MKLVHIYECFCDEFRLRILNLLLQGPLCVCHLQEVLDADQVKTSKQLRFMMERGLLERHRYQNWNIYALPLKRPSELERNLACLQDCLPQQPVFKQDLRRLKKISIDCDLENQIVLIQETSTPNKKKRNTNAKPY